MKIRILSVGHKMPKWVTQGCEEYLKRMPREMTVDIVEIKPGKRAAGKSGDQIREIEAERLLDAAGNDKLVVLDEHGQEPTTLQLAKKIQSWQEDGRNIALVVGGADGLHEKIIQAAEWKWSLSQLTMPHSMVRIVLAEQLYRAWSVITNHPYHRGDIT